MKSEKIWTSRSELGWAEGWHITVITPSSKNTGLHLFELCDRGIYLAHNAELFYIGCSGVTWIKPFQINTTLCRISLFYFGSHLTLAWRYKENSCREFLQDPSLAREPNSQNPPSSYLPCGKWGTALAKRCDYDAAKDEEASSIRSREYLRSSSTKEPSETN